MGQSRFLQVAVGVVAALFMAEGVARLDGDVLCSNTPGAFLGTDPRFGWMHLPHLRALVGQCGDHATPAAPFETNAQGLRDPERPYAKPPGTVRILLLGGSLAEGVGVRRDQSVVGYLEQRADLRRGPRLEVINAAIGNFALDNVLAFYRAEGRRYAPDVVVLLIDPVVDTQGLSPKLLRDLGVPVPDKPYLQLVDGALAPAPRYQPFEVQSPMPVAAAGPLAWSQLYRRATGLPRTVATPMQRMSLPSVTPDYDASQENTRAFELATAITHAIVEDARADGASTVAILGPVLRQGPPPFGTLTEDVRLRRKLAADGVPTANLGPAFAGHRRNSGETGFFPETARFDRGGHFLTSQVTWDVLTREHLLPGVVAARTVDAGRIPVRPGEFLATLWDARHTLFVRLVVWGLFAVALLWTGRAFPAAIQPWWSIVVGAGLGAILATPPLAAAVLLASAVPWAVIEWLPRRLANVALVGLLAAGVALPVLWVANEPAMDDIERRVWLAFVTNVLLLRLVAYAVDRRRGEPPLGLRDYLAALWFLPTAIAGPIERVQDTAARRPGRPQYGLGLGAVVAALTLHGVARFVLNTPAADIYVTAGMAVGRGRLWVWFGELAACVWCTWAAWSLLAIGFGRLLGASLVPDFPLPRGIGDAGDIWRGTFASVGRWMHRYVYVPLGGAGRASVATPVVFAIAGAWVFWWGLKQLGPGGFQVSAAIRLGVWAAMNAGAVLAARLARHRLGDPLGRLVGLGTVLVVLLAWVPFMSPAWHGWHEPLRVVARLLGLG